MGARKSIVIVSFVLAVIVAGVVLLAGNSSLLRAAQETGKSPRASLHIARRPPHVLFSTAEDPEDYPRYLKMQEILIKSRLVLSSALRDPKIAGLPSIKDRPDPFAWLQQYLEVTNPRDTEILQISMASGSGASGADQATLINAVKRAYMDKVVNVDTARRAEKLKQLKGLKDKYGAILNAKRETVRKLSETAGGGEHLLDPKKDVLHRLAYDLRTRRLQLRLERTEAETLLERRKKADGSATEPARKEIAALEDRLAVLKASQTVLDEELERLAGEMQHAAILELDLEQHKDEIAQMEETARKIGAEVEALNIEIQAPPRIRLIDDAVPAGP
jgi:hypothetical protein